MFNETRKSDWKIIFDLIKKINLNKVHTLHCPWASIVLIMIGFTLISTSVYSQQTSIKFDHISLEKGLSQSSVLTILQDKKGFMWFGTFDGLNKYDGYTMKVFQHNPLDTNTITDNTINVVYEDSRGVLWIGTRSKGICLYNPLTEGFINISHKNKTKLSDKNIKAIFEDSKGVIWLGTENGLNICKRQGKEFLIESVDLMNILNISEVSIQKITEDQNNKIWIATNRGLIKTTSNVSGKNYLFDLHTVKNGLNTNNITSLMVDKQNRLWIGTTVGVNVAILGEEKDSLHFISMKFNEKDTFSISNNVITAFAQDADNDIWVGTLYGGVNKLIAEKTLTKPKFYRFVHDPLDYNSLSVNSILCLYHDKSNVLWIGTSLGGVDKGNKTFEGFNLYRHTPYNQNTLGSSQIRSVYQDTDGIFWIGTVDAGLNKWNPNNGKFTRFSANLDKPGALSHNHVRAIMEDKDKNLWIGTDGGGLLLMNRSSATFQAAKYDSLPGALSSNSIWNIEQSPDGKLWLATFGGGIAILDYDKSKPLNKNVFQVIKQNKSDKKSLNNNLVTDIFFENENEIYVATFGGGLNYSNDGGKTFANYRHATSDSTSICDDRLYSLTKDSKENLWIGTKAGLSKLNLKTKIFENFYVQNGLANNVVMGILEDKDGYIWLSTNKGLCKFDGNTKFRNFDILDGLQSNEFLVGAYHKTKDNMLLFGGINGLNAFYPEKISTNLFAPQTVITNFLVFNNKIVMDSAVSEKKHIFLNYNQNFISFEFVSLNYTFPEKNQYSYFLSGLENNWTYVGNRRYATYANLPPGVYEFKVKGSNNDGIWNEKGTSIFIHIAPPFWKTWWFYTLLFVFIVLTVYGYIKWRERALKQENEHLETIVVERTSEILIQKQQIEQQRDLAKLQHKQLEANIEYASKIQEAIFPPDDDIEKIFPDYFVFYRPKEIVSGDYYWMVEKDNKVFMAVADCTGHGVSGAFLSVMGVAMLNAIMYTMIHHQFDTIKPSQILGELRNTVKDSLHQTGKPWEQKDGMDIAFCIVDRNEFKLQYAGAFSPLFLIHKGEFFHMKADKMSICLHYKEKEFTDYEMDIAKDDCIYIFSDGYIDQFGGPKKRRFLSKKFEETLLEVHQKTMKEQKEILMNTFDAWKGEYDQVDDVLVMGVRV